MQRSLYKRLNSDLQIQSLGPTSSDIAIQEGKCLSIADPEDVLFCVEGEGCGFLRCWKFWRVRGLLTQLRGISYEDEGETPRASHPLCRERLMSRGDSDRVNVKTAWVDVFFLELPMCEVIPDSEDHHLKINRTQFES